MFRGCSNMGPRLWWLPVVATLVLVALAGLLDGAEGGEQPGQSQGGRSEGSTTTLRMIRTTQHQRKLWRPYRLGSLSALSRGLMKTQTPPPEEREGGGPRPARETGANGRLPLLPETTPGQAKVSRIFPAAKLRRENCGGQDRNVIVGNCGVRLPAGSGVST